MLWMRDGTYSECLQCSRMIKLSGDLGDHRCAHITLQRYGVVGAKRYCRVGTVQVLYRPSVRQELLSSVCTSTTTTTTSPSISLFQSSNPIRPLRSSTIHPSIRPSTMAPAADDKSQTPLKRPRVCWIVESRTSQSCVLTLHQASTDELENDSQKKPRFVQATHLPSPETRKASNSTDDHLTGDNGASQPSDKRVSPPPFIAGLHSPPSDTQPYSQFLTPAPISYEVEDEKAEGVWGYLVPLDGVSDALVLRTRAACPVPQSKVGRTDGKNAVPRDEYLEQEDSYEKEKAEKGIPAGGYLIGRHPECGQCYSLHIETAQVINKLTKTRPPHQETYRQQPTLSFVC
jgi:hypothetical protein